MKCPKCQTDNPETRKFCRECGVSLSLRCAQCGCEYFPGDRFCGECGHQLTVALEPVLKDLSFDEKLDKLQRYLPDNLTERILAQRGKIEGERRQVTVMFCDLKGFTPLCEKLGEEKMYSIIDELFEMMIHKVHDYEGTVNKWTGDGIMALFGAPIAVEDAPQRAVRSALAMQREMAVFGGVLREESGLPPLRMRIGIHSGPVVVGTMGNDLRVEFTAVGDTVNLASRMEGLAEPGTVYVTGDTFNLTKGFFRFEALGERQVSGREQPVKVYRVIAPSTSRTRFDVSTEQGLTPFVGRQRELELLLDGFERARAGRGQAFSVMGEAGVGKSRLLYEFRKAIGSEDVTFLEGKCLSYSRGVAYHPVIDILKSTFNIGPGDADYRIRDRVKEELRRLRIDEDSALPYVLELLGVRDSGMDKISMGREDKRHQIMEALRQITIKGAEIRPLIMAIEDLHWADRSSEEALKYILESIPGARILLIFTYRPEFIHSWGSRSYHSQVTLNRLSNRESLAMLAYVLGTEEIETQLQDLVLEKTEGIPFFIEEFMKSLKDLKIIEQRDGGYHLTRDVHDVTIPGTIQDVIMARVDSLPDAARGLLQAASAIEREFDHGLIKRVAGIPEQELLSHMSVLKDAELLYERGIYPQSTYIFRHALTREVVYGSILASRKKKLHLDIANAIEDVHREDLDEYHSVLAEHFSYSSDSADLEKSIRYGEIAARRASAVYAYGEAVRLLEQACRVQEVLDPDDKARRCDLLLELGRARGHAHEYQHILGHEAPMALSLAEELGDSERACRACWLATFVLIASVAYLASDASEFVKWAEAYDRYASPGTVHRAWAGSVIAHTKELAGDIAGAVSLLRESTLLARKLSDADAFVAAGSVYVSDCPPTAEHVGETRRLAEEIMGMWDGVESWLACSPRVIVGSFLLKLGERQEAEEIHRQLAESPRFARLPFVRYLGPAVRACYQIMDGHLDEAAQAREEVLRTGVELGAPGMAAALSGWSEIRLSGYLGWGLEGLKRAEERAERTGVPVSAFNRAYHLLYASQVKEATAALDGFVDQYSAEPDKVGHFQLRQIIVLETAVLARHTRAAELLLGLLGDTLFKTTGLPWTTCVARHLGGAAALLDRPDEAREYYQEAIWVSTDMRFRPELALARLELAELILEHYPHDKKEAVEHLAYCIPEFRDMKMQPWLERALKHKENLEA